MKLFHPLSLIKATLSTPPLRDARLTRKSKDVVFALIRRRIGALQEGALRELTSEFGKSFRSLASTLEPISTVEILADQLVYWGTSRIGE